jgi:hypothetical protein
MIVVTLHIHAIQEWNMFKPALLLSLFALILSACTFDIGLFEPGQANPTKPVLMIPNAPQPSATPVVVLATVAPVALPTQTVSPSGLLYFWPVALSPEMKLNEALSFSNESGYMIAFTNPQTGAATVLRAGAEADRYPYCAGQSSPYQIRNVEGCSSLGTGAGASLEWKENGIHYALGGLGNALDTLIQFAGTLAVLDHPAWQQALANAAKLENTGQAVDLPARIRIEFAPGTTASSTAYRELAVGGFEEYVLNALQGQELAVDAAPYNFADSANFVISVTGVDGAVLAAEAAQLNSWSGVLPTTQAYIIRVTNRGNAAQYRLNVTIPWRINFAAGATSTSLDGKLIAGSNGNLYSLRAQAGQTLTLSTTSANNHACLTVAAKMTNGGFVPLLSMMSQPTTSWSTVLPTGSDYAQDYSILVSMCPQSPAADTPYTLLVDIVN